MNATAKLLPTLAALALAISLAGCVTPTPPPGPQGRDATLGLIRHPEFGAAATAAPQWVDEALRIITTYEAELARPVK